METLPLDTPVLFGSARQFKFSVQVSGVVVFIAFQSEQRGLVTKMVQSRLKALGCGSDDPEAWSVPESAHVGGAAVKHARLLHFGTGGPALGTEALLLGAALA